MAEHTCDLLLRIDQTLYRVERIDEAAWRVTKLFEDFSDSPENYECSVDQRHGPSCTCWDWLSRRQNTPIPSCKHLWALREETLLDFTTLGEKGVDE